MGKVFSLVIIFIVFIIGIFIVIFTDKVDDYIKLAFCVLAPNGIIQIGIVAKSIKQ